MKRNLVFILIIVSVYISSFSQRVYMIGDSHVSSKYYPTTVENTLREKYPNIKFDYFAKVGASFNTYNNTKEFQQKIYDFKPDILIVHLGTNDSYSVNFSSEKFKNNVERFYNLIRDCLPECKIVFVTPFDNRLKKGVKLPADIKEDDIVDGRVLNPFTAKCSDEIVYFCEEHPWCYVADNNYEHGLDFVKDNNLIRNDYVHLTVDGYKLLGKQVGEEILNIAPLYSK